MRFLKTSIVVLFLAAVLIPASMNRAVHSQDATSTGTTDQANVAAARDATYTPGSVDLEGVPENDQTTYTFRTEVNPPAAGGPSGISPTSSSAAPAQLDRSESSAFVTDPGDGGGGGTPVCFQPATADALTGFDDKTNNFIPQGSPSPTTPHTFFGDKEVFEEVDDIAKGLGPVYNAQSCKECHQNPVTGAISQITELRAGHNVVANNVTTFVDAPGGSLINDRGIPTPNYNGDPKKSAKVQERVPPLYTAGIIGGGPAILPEPTPTIRTFRTSLNTLGDGFVEAIADGSLVAIANNQPVQTGNEVHGLAITVPVLEAPGALRVGRFGWKDQHGSLLSFSGDAYLNEIGITNFLILTENTSLGRFVGFGSGFDLVPDNTPCTAHPGVICGEDADEDIRVFAEFMRATKAPPRDPDIISDVRYQTDVQQGAQLFAAMFDKNGNLQYSCSVCHVPAIVTAPACTKINGGMFTVPVALANKVLRPFGDFLLHDVGTGDFIVQNGGPVTRTKVRTAPLWGVRTRDRLMHDGESLTFNDAILRHAGEASAVVGRYQLLSVAQKRQLITFLESL
jgi:CxxC motif-containing protein (DUF1111 family)